MPLVLDGVLALSQGVPQLDGLVPASGHDLPVVHREGHGEDVLGVVLEPAGGLAGAQIPQPQVLVPGPGQSKVAVGAEDHVRHEVGMAVQSLLRHSVLPVLAGQLPHDQGLVAATGQDHVRVLRVGGDLGHPPALLSCTNLQHFICSAHLPVVAPQGSTELKSLGHVVLLLLLLFSEMLNHYFCPRITLL